MASGGRQWTIGFCAVDPFMIVNDYDIEIPQEAVDVLEIQSSEHVMILSILVVPEDLSKISMNLKAPVIINTKIREECRLSLTRIDIL